MATAGISDDRDMKDELSVAENGDGTGIEVNLSVRREQRTTPHFA